MSGLLSERYVKLSVRPRDILKGSLLADAALLLRRDGQEDDALRLFERAAGLGSEYAKSMMVQLNPYAAMCNKMLKNIFRALETGSDEVLNPFRNVERHESQG